ncbi:hypothetical protein [Phenylobacterium sp.]|uniref:hypothetical protein n=1 Tax=Phenylobacterium sp. TaxID=1871053 RepID=UPI002ED7F089
MRAPAPAATQSARPHWAGLLLASALFHALVLGGFAFRMPTIRTYAEPAPMSLVQPPPLIRPLVIETAKPSPKTRVVILYSPPRYASQTAPTGDAGDAVDLFGPVFADGLWPRPVLVRSEPCDPEDDPERADACRRELMLIGLASDAATGAKAQP